jgi:hypothetical protein
MPEFLSLGGEWKPVGSATPKKLSIAEPTWESTLPPEPPQEPIQPETQEQPQEQPKKRGRKPKK